MSPSRTRLVGFGLTAAASVMWSTGGLFSRSIDLDITTTLLWRSLFGALSLMLIVVVRDRRRIGSTIRSLGLAGVLAVPVSAVAMVSYVAALKLTTVANIMVVYATLPFVAAGIAFLWVGERPSRRVLAASAVALLGIGILAGSMAGADVLGDTLAFVMTVAFALLLVLARQRPGIDMATLNAAAALLCVVLCLPFAARGVPDSAQLLRVAGFGIVCTGLGFLLYLTGSRSIPSAEAGLLSSLDVVLGPFWMWLAFDERPAIATIIGGVLVFGAVAAVLVAEIRDARRAGHRAGRTALGATVDLPGVELASERKSA